MKIREQETGSDLKPHCRDRKETGEMELGQVPAALRTVASQIALHSSLLFLWTHALFPPEAEPW